jgi:hypothetical protein
VEPSAPSQEDRLYEVKFVAAINLGMFTIILGFADNTQRCRVFPAAYNKQVLSGSTQKHGWMYLPPP